MIKKYTVLMVILGMPLFQLTASVRPPNFGMLPGYPIGGMAKPKTPDHIAYLQDKGVRLIVSLTPKPLKQELFANSLVKNIHIPIANDAAPTYEDAKKFLTAVDKELQKGNTVIVHCKHGEGRTGTMLATWLIHNENMTVQQALATIDRRLHSEQKLFLDDFYAWQKNQPIDWNHNKNILEFTLD